LSGDAPFVFSLYNVRMVDGDFLKVGGLRESALQHLETLSSPADGGVALLFLSHSHLDWYSVAVHSLCSDLISSPLVAIALYCLALPRPNITTVHESIMLPGTRFWGCPRALRRHVCLLACLLLCQLFFLITVFRYRITCLS